MENQFLKEDRKMYLHLAILLATVAAIISVFFLIYSPSTSSENAGDLFDRCIVSQGKHPFLDKNGAYLSPTRGKEGSIARPLEKSRDYFSKGVPELALEEFLEWENVDEQDTLSFAYEKAFLYLELNDTISAIQEFQYVIRDHQSRKGYAVEVLAILFLRQSQPGRASDLINEALAHPEGIPEETLNDLMTIIMTINTVSEKNPE